MPRKDKKYRVAIIGAGRIAAGFDAPGDKQILTHAHAYQAHTKTELVGIYDIRKSAADEAAKKWSTQAFDDLAQMLRETKPEIISICTPDEAHVSALMQLSAFGPSMVICEKPIAASLAEAKRAVKKFEKKKIPLLINQILRFDATMQTLRSQLRRGAYGRVISASALYAKGILHNGIHILDLGRFLFGEAGEVRALFARKDGTGEDKTVGGFVNFERCPQFHLMAGDERVTSVYEFDILCQKRRFRVTDAGFVISEQAIVADPYFPGYRALGAPDVLATGLGNAMMALLDNAIQNLERGEPLLCPASDALKSYSICVKLLAQSKRLCLN